MDKVTDSPLVTVDPSADDAVGVAVVLKALMLATVAATGTSNIIYDPTAKKTIFFTSKRGID